MAKMKKLYVRKKNILPKLKSKPEKKNKIKVTKYNSKNIKSINNKKKYFKSNANKIRLLLMGPQGCGKGTQAEMIAKKYSIPHISTGEIFRELEKKETPLGKEIRRLIDNGLLAPDELTNEVVKQRLSRGDCKKGYILDGYPRNLAQAHFLESISMPNVCIFLDISEEESVKRLGSRRICSLCKADYNILSVKPRREGRCDKCSGTLVIRKDDAPEAIKLRLRQFHVETEPLVEFYNHKKILSKLNGEEPVELIYKKILEVLKKQSKK